MTRCPPGTNRLSLSFLSDTKVVFCKNHWRRKMSRTGGGGGEVGVIIKVLENYKFLVGATIVSFQSKGGGLALPCSPCFDAYGKNAECTCIRDITNHATRTAWRTADT